ncbi:MAG TPA: prolyl aminopeptidase [Steroidobacteraceae bacterium]|nr:prolyl aminopeptidase [Steroidobacteraceae bacterium]
MARTGDLYPSIEPFRTGRLPVDDIHTIYWEECGNPTGVPVLFLHGGPGAGCSPEHRRFFDPQYYRIVLFDQRGAGRSTPHGETTNNTTAHLVSDIEALREMLKIPVWNVFGGSWGSTLALAYAQAHPQPCLSLTLRGIFLLQASEVDWFLHGIRNFAPREWEQFVGFLPESLRGNLCDGYWTQLNHELPEIRLAAANSWASYEARSVSLRTNAAVPAPAPAGASPPVMSASASHSAVGLARLEVHYMRSNQFVPDDALLRGVERIRHIPCAIVQGKYDLLCPPITAVALHAAWPESTLQIIEDAGHSAFEPSIRAALVATMDGRRTASR